MSLGTRKFLVLRSNASTWSTNLSLPASTMALVLRSLAAPPARTSALPMTPPFAPNVRSRAIRLSITFTTPPMALPPYSKVAGPRSTSIRSVVRGSMGTAWSLLKPDTSMLAPLFCKIRMRSPSIPRITGRPTLGPNELLEMPGKLSSVSPKVLPWRWVSAAPESCCAGTSKPAASKLRAVMVTSSKRWTSSLPVVCAHELPSVREKNE